MKKIKITFKSFLILMITVIMVCIIPSIRVFAQADYSVSTFSEFQTAISSAPTDESEYTIEVIADITFDNVLLIPTGTNIKVLSNGSSPWTLTQSVSVVKHFGVSGSLTLNNIILDGNGVGGGVESNGGELVLDAGAIVRNCYTGASGGGIYAYGNATVTLKSGSEVSGNEANADINNYNIGIGGGIYAYPATLIMEKGAKVSDNTASYAGGIYTGGTAFINGTVSSNISYHSGGGIYYVQIGTQVLNMDGAEVTGNIAYGYGGPSPGNSYVGTGGGGLYIIFSNSTSGDIVIKNSTFSNNQAPTVRNTSINNGQDYYTGHQYGGAIYVSSGKNVDTKLLFESCSFIGNEARLGGALSLNCETEIIECVFDGNLAYDDRTNSNSSGGAIYFNAAKGNVGNTYLLRILGGEIKGSTAYNGAGISLTNSNVYQVYVNGTKFGDNQIIEDGYAWDINNPTGYEAVSQAAFNGLSFAEVYKQNITNVTITTSPYTNIYNNADIRFMLYRVVIYNGNGGVFLSSDINSEFGTSFTTDLPSITFSYDQGELLEHPESIPYKESDTFLGWYMEDLISPAPEDDTLVYKNYEFYALWQSEVHTVTYASGTAESVSNMPQPGTVTSGTSFTVSSNTPSRSGYTFIGWNTKVDGNGAMYKPEETFTVTADVILYAQWKKENITSQEKSSVSPENIVPKTGDNTSLFIWVSLLFAAVAILFIIYIVKRRNDKA